jgi:hypothetical protein
MYYYRIAVHCRLNMSCKRKMQRIIKENYACYRYLTFIFMMSIRYKGKFVPVLN